MALGKGLSASDSGQSGGCVCGCGARAIPSPSLTDGQVMCLVESVAKCDFVSVAK